MGQESEVEQERTGDQQAAGRAWSYSWSAWVGAAEEAQCPAD